MNTFQPNRYEHGHSMLLAGLRHHHNYNEAVASIPVQWRTFVQQLPLPGQAQKTTYGVVCGHDASSFEYMTGVEVSSFDGLPAETGRVRIQPARYAVFVHSGAIANIRETWQKIYDWLLHSSYESSHTPDFERYDERFDPQTGMGDVEVWVGVVHRTD